MPYVESRGVPRIADLNVTIWRYFDLPKFVSLLQKRSLFFSKLALLGDPFEGSLPRGTVEEQAIRKRLAEEQGNAGGARTPEQYQQIRRGYREYTYVNCWHQNDRESAAMWALYAPGGAGVAIRSSISSLIDAVSAYKPMVNIAAVQYLDELSGRIDESTIYSAWLWKRRSFEHEREVRALTCDWPAIGEIQRTADFAQNPLPGVYVPVALDRLIDTVYVAPQSPDWYQEVVQSVVVSYLEASCEVQKSGLDTTPLY